MKTKKGSKKSDSASLVPKKDVPTPLTDDLREEFRQFLDFHSAQRLSKNLRKMLLEFLSNDGALETVYLKDLLYDLDGLFDLLDVIEKTQAPFEE
ncbi:MAG TPA: hypothetical protein VKZ75_02270 [Cyclobacteriaceae bacterium]|nr:hypothetical protein [Cyclobacteriaceae bacterium]